MKNNKKQKGFTLIELLVVIAIIAILAVVVILTLNPAELLRQARDSNRVSDFATMKSALSLYATDVATSSWMSGGLTNANASTVFYSATTSTVGISTFATSTGSTSCVTSTPTAGSWGFAGGENAVSSSAAGAAGRAINGTGWIPINFNAISSGAPLSALPVDPVDTGVDVYAFVGQQTTWKLATKTESVKYSMSGSGDVDSTDGGNSNCALEAGTNMAL